MTVQNLLIKASALAMAKVPDLNASWKDTHVRRYNFVDINLIQGTGSNIRLPLLRDVGRRGLSSLSKELASLSGASTDQSASLHQSIGTFSIHDLGQYGIMH